MRTVELTPKRQSVGRLMSTSKRYTPHFYVTAEVELDAGLALLAEINASAEGSARVSLTGLLVHGCARALARHPWLNAVWEQDRILMAEDVNISVAVALDDGLVAPALLDCLQRPLRETGTALRDLVERARKGRLRRAEMANGTFTISNLGMYGVTSFVPIITPPQVAILGVGAVARRFRPDPVGEMATRAVANLTVSADHRVVDGAAVAAFLQTLKAILLSPEELLA